MYRHPDPAAPAKLAVSYSILNFQDPRFANSRMPQQSYIWDILNPNMPDTELLPPSPLCCLRYHHIYIHTCTCMLIISYYFPLFCALIGRFNPKNTDSLVGGSYNGLITFYDLRRSGATYIHLFTHKHIHICKHVLPLWNANCVNRCSHFEGNPSFQH